MSTDLPKLVLASGSPRRRELLETVGLEFEIRPPDVEELQKSGEGPDAYVRRLGQDRAKAPHLTQGFFAKLLEKNYVSDADRERGRFRTFLLASLKHFMANEWDREKAAKRIAELQQQRDQVVGYMVLEGEEDHRTMVKEVLVTPVFEDGNFLGMF